MRHTDFQILPEEQCPWTLRVGVIYIASSLTLEQEWHAVLPKDISFHTSRISLENDDATEKTLMDMLESGQVEKAARELASCGVDVIAFGCTAGSFIKGIEWDRELARKITDAAGGIPAVTTSGGLLWALRTFGCASVNAVTPYLDEVTERERIFLEGNGIRVVNIAGFGCLKDQDICRVEPRRFIEWHLSMDCPASQAAFISCTNSRSIEAIRVLERILKKPVLSSNQVTLWAALKTAGYAGSIKGYGVLLESHL